MPIKQKSWLLLLIFTLYYLIPIEIRPLWQPDETRYAEISREMLVEDNWIVPRLLDLRYFEKPAAGYWVNNLSQLLFGHNNFAVRFGVVLSSALSALGVFWLALRIWREQHVALMAAIIYLTCLLVLGVGTYAVLDPMLALWMTAAMCAFWLAVTTSELRQRILAWLLLGVACGMGFMTKGFLALVIPVISVLPWVIVQNRWKMVLSWGWLALFAALIVSLPWVIAVAKYEPDFWRYFIWEEHIRRFADPDAQHKAPFWYYLPVMLVGVLPWLALMPGALKLGWLGRKEDNSSAFFLLCWFIMPLILLSISKGKLLTYVLPCFAPLAILMAQNGYVALQRRIQVFKINGAINLVFGLICLSIDVILWAPWGLAKHPIYASYEIPKVLITALAFSIWLLAGFLCWCAPKQRWYWVAFCPLGVALLVGSATPQFRSSNKHPQPFISAVHNELITCRYVLSNSSGVASSLAWGLKRSDILMYDGKGELSYGLSYPDSRYRYVSQTAFVSWLAKARTTGNVALVLQLDRRQDPIFPRLPMPDFVWHQGRLVLYKYYQRS